MYVQPFKLHDKQYFSPFYLGRLWYVGFGSIINLIFVHKHVWMKKTHRFLHQKHSDRICVTNILFWMPKYNHGLQYFV